MLSGRRCSSRSWTYHCGAGRKCRVFAERKCNSDSSCAGLGWYHGNHTATKYSDVPDFGWFQSCKKSASGLRVGSVGWKAVRLAIIPKISIDTAWTTIIKPPLRMPSAFLESSLSSGPSHLCMLCFSSRRLRLFLSSRTRVFADACKHTCTHVLSFRLWTSKAVAGQPADCVPHH